MKLWTAIFAFLLAPPLWAGEDALGLPAPTSDVRIARDIQSRAWGSPSLDSSADRGDLALALAEMSLAAVGGSPAAGGMGAQDYDALFALLQRYRDDLLKLGLAGSELDAQIKTLEIRAQELKNRVDKLKPKDGLKIHARIYSFFDDMHLLGNAPLSGPAFSLPKPAGQGLRFQSGGAHTAIKLTGTRGPLTAMVQYDVTLPWGLRGSMAGARKLYFELRLPVALQFGDIDANLSPLTLWRNDRDQPYEPEPFKSRETRLRDDLLLQPDKWPVQGFRLSTDLRLFNAADLEMESITFIAGYTGAPIYVRSNANLFPANNNMVLQERYTTFGEGWRIAIPIAEVVTLSQQGMLFWDETATQQGAAYRAMNSLVYSGAADLKAGVFHAGAEYALSSYQHPALAALKAPDPLTGTALTYFVALQGKTGHLKAYGRMVADSFHSPAAQGRTVDEAYQYLGFFLTENSQLNAIGGMGLDSDRLPSGSSGQRNGNIPLNYGSRLNTILIPPGVVNSASGLGGQFQHLLDYSPVEVVDPYGAATPNRSGFGAEFKWNFASGGLKPSAFYEAYSHLVKVIDRWGSLADPFVMTRMGGGLALDLKPLLDWPLRFGAGYTMGNSKNGGKNVNGKDYGLSTTLLEGGAEWDFLENMGLNVGYRHLDAAGFNETFIVAEAMAFDLIGVGFFWKPIRDLRLDVVYSQQFFAQPKVPAAAFEMDHGLIRMTAEF